MKRSLLLLAALIGCFAACAPARSAPVDAAPAAVVPAVADLRVASMPDGDGETAAQHCCYCAPSNVCHLTFTACSIFCNP